MHIAQYPQEPIPARCLHHSGSFTACTASRRASLFKQLSTVKKSVPRRMLQPDLHALQVLDKAASFCMHAFNPRILTEYIHLRGPLGLPPSRDLSQALKLRLLQIVHELDFADIAACLPPLLPGEAGQEVLGAACRQVGLWSSCC